MERNRAESLLTAVARIVAGAPDYARFKDEIVSAITQAFDGGEVEIVNSISDPILALPDTIGLVFAGKMVGGLRIAAAPALNEAERISVGDCGGLIASRIAAETATAALDTEPLTGLASRRAFDRTVERTWQSTSEPRNPVAIIIVDVDLFKGYNDRYGHPAGDRCLRRVAEVMAQTCGRPGDILARWGGEEFIALLLRCDSAGAIHVAENIRRAVEQENISHEGSGLGHVTVSIGVASALPTLTDAASLIAYADAALYAAKERGRNRVCDEAYTSDSPRAAHVFAPILRPRVVDALKKTAEYRIALLNAPAGYGKSTALAEFLESHDEAVVRYDLRVSNSTLAGFARGLAQACERIAPNLIRSFADAYDERNPAVVAQLAEWFSVNLHGFSGVIVLDDIHIALADPRCVELIVALVDATPVAIRWLFAGRTLAGLPVATWIAYEHATEPVDMEVLRFRPQEFEMIAQRVNSGLTPATLNALEEVTAGWPVAVTFALRSGVNIAELAGQSSNRARIYQYLSEQVFSGLAPELCDFLLETALLPNLDLAVLDAMHVENAAARLGLILEQGVFIVREGDGLCRYHDLFRDFLWDRLESRNVDVHDLARRSAAAVAQGGALEPALRLCIRFKIADLTGDLIDRHWQELWLRGNLELVSEAAAVLPADEPEQRIVRAGVEAVLAAQIGKAGDGRQLWSSLAALPGDPERRNRWRLRVADAMLNLYDASDGGELRALSEYHWHSRSDEIAAKSAFSLWLLQFGDRNLALELAEQAVATAATLADSRARAVSLRVLSRVQFVVGATDAAARTAEKLSAFAAEHGLARAQLSAELVLSDYTAYEKEAIHCRSGHIRTSCRLAEEVGAIALRAIATSTAFLLAAEEGDEEFAASCMLQWSALSEKTDHIFVDDLVRPMAIQAASTGNFRKAFEVFSIYVDGESRIRYDDASFVGPALAARAMYAAFANLPREASEALAAAIRVLDQVHHGSWNNHHTLRGHVKVAITHVMLGDFSAARAILDKLESDVSASKVCTHAFLRMARVMLNEALGVAPDHARQDAMRELERVGFGGFARVFAFAPVPVMYGKPAELKG